ncbi:MAG: tetratricopeptide repeat protein [Deltaproteobacteria bacterium]|nr:tetratricopeptide repeat protein [Deltaproteobacteria bacterium]
MRAFFVLATLLCLATAAPASAQRDNPLIQEGADQYDELRYEEALQTLSAALVRAGNTDQQRARIYTFLAFTYLSLGREAEAEGAYRSLLAIVPAFEPDASVSPRFREFFSGVRDRWEAEGRPGSAPPSPATIEHTSPPQADPGESVELRASLDDPSGRIVSVVLAYRQGTSDVYRRLDTQLVEGEYVATIPGDDVAPPLVEYYFEGLDANNLPVASRGDVAAPLRIAVEGEGDSGIVGKWWFWTILGVVVVGGAVTTAVLLTRDDGGPSETQGTFVISIGE